ncbi:anthranilate synthase component I family protein [Pedobacter duraquae]|uniref:Para-aminobenzoate synthetase component 1 n=1 Tax=Pedobacter duraquae TaxID=425511 RepID=A0A4R6IRB2_9SPHI|nr:anthranilate synthase component I family protein [Pedobacter duraquae]TDO24952.1 para-aminobenzoate synthetase component 1 [Pedobacter duraquae]
MTTQELTKQKALLWAAQFENCCFLDSNHYTDHYSSYEVLIAAGSKQVLSTSEGNAFAELKSFYDANQSWMFGLLGYDLKNEIELLNSSQPDELGFPDLFFFIPEYVIGIKNDAIEIILGNSDILEQISQLEIKQQAWSNTELQIEQKLEKEQYLNVIDEIRSHINRGDIYEVTFCQEFFARNARIDPLLTFQRLSEVSPTPFSGFMKIAERYILSASPERFLCKRDNTLISQPIKGTAGRGKDNAEDELIKAQLRGDQKEQAENVMIVDLVRNDLTKSAVAGSVQVTELFGIYSFTQVHQMISTITCELRPDIHFIDAIKNTFPMGSMTGAPKIRAMGLIDQFEKSRRGAFSGALGYITPDGNFDFNVIIRSILYNAANNYMSFQVGGAITFASDPLQEYEECMIKASALMETLKGPL